MDKDELPFVAAPALFDASRDSKRKKSGLKIPFVLGAIVVLGGALLFSKQFRSTSPNAMAAAPEAERSYQPDLQQANISQTPAPEPEVSQPAAPEPAASPVVVTPPPPPVVVVTPPTTVVATPVRTKTTVQINAKPWANVFIDGASRRSLGQTPLSGVSVTVGDVLVFENPDFPTKTYRITEQDAAIQVNFP